jgi:hypothetical protein
VSECVNFGVAHIEFILVRESTYLILCVKNLS